MRILIPIAAFGHAGGFRVLSELANAWLSAGHEVDFLADSRSPPPYFPTRARILRYRTDGSLESAPAQASQMAPKGNQWSVWRGMWRALNRIGAEYDVILANQSMTTFPVALARTGAASKWYYIQAYEPELYQAHPDMRRRMLGALSMLSYRLPLQQIANAPIYVGYRSIRARSWVPPGIDMDLFSRRDTPPRFAPGSPIVLGTIGRSEPNKGTADVLSAFELLAAQYPNVRLSVAFGNLPSGWSHPRAEVVVPQGDAALAAWYRSVDVVVATATFQLGACHYPVIEAMASGTPVITTGYLPADRFNAWIVPVRAPSAIADAVRSMMAMTPEDRATKLDLAAMAVRRFEWHQVAEEFLVHLGGTMR